MNLAHGANKRCIPELSFAPCTSFTRHILSSLQRTKQKVLPRIWSVTIDAMDRRVADRPVEFT